ncbi:MAG TPA: endonuclease [Lachnospiraceae bacterium]|nr:endonuclease [Lachnospiraceae bacterium]
MLFGGQEELKKRTAERVKQYISHLNEYKRPTYNETEVRVDFVNPFFKSLGWDVDNEAGLPQHLREVTHEATVLVDEGGERRSKKPDYSFRIGTEILFYLETKKPYVDITTDNAPAFQLRRYGWSGNLKISVLTNYNDLYIYDCTVRPVEDDDIGVALIAHYTYEEYVEKFDEIYGLLSKEAVLSGNFASNFDNIRGAFRREPFDEYFLKQIRSWRLILGEDIAGNNPGLDSDTLNISVQRILNRIIFLRICEDRSFEEYELLKGIKNYDELKELFLAADKKYDSGLFEMLEEDKFCLSDEVLIDIFISLYYPNNSYEFDVVDPYIIGQIYELFLDEKLEIDRYGHVSQENKPEAVDSQGAVNTPKNVTDIIIEQTLSDIFAGKTVDEVLELRVADICCGSGNFLLSAYEFAVNYCLDWYMNNDKASAIRLGLISSVPGSDVCRLSYEIKREILVNTIWGVDIDPLAVEVAKFSLFLKLLEDASPQEIGAYAKRTRKSLLPRLDDNIKNGNSLVDMSYAAFFPGIYGDEAKLEMVKMFDWKTEFGGKGFDAIVGNPPYIRVQNMVRYSPEEYAFYKSRYSGYQTAGSDLLDKYFLFIERAWMLLRKNGVIGYIVPHKFMNIMSGDVMRRFLTERSAVKKIIHFGTHQAFKNRSTYTCILVLSKERQNEFDIAFVREWNRFLFDHKVSFEKYDSGTLGESPWIFIPKQVSERLSEISQKCRTLESFSDIFVGVQTSADKIYIVYANQEDDEYVYFTDKKKESRKVEKGILRKSVYDARLSKFEKIAANSYIIFPYVNENGKPRLVDIGTVQEQYPEAFSYLSDFREELDKRNMPGRTEETWYAYGRSQSLKRFVGGEHLIWPVLSLEANYVYDDEMVVFTGGGNGPFYGIEMKRDVKESIFYIQAILNHWLMEMFVKKSASTFRGGYYSHGKQFIAKLPVYSIDWDDKDDVAKHDAIVEKVHLIEYLTDRMNHACNQAAHNTMKRSVAAAEKDLECLIDQLYGVQGLRMEMPDETD